MKTFVAMTLCLFSLGSWAHMHEDMDKMMDKMSFEDAKKMKTEMLDKKSAMIEEAKRCVNDSKDKEALKMCMKKMHEQMEGMHHHMKEKMMKKK